MQNINTNKKVIKLFGVLAFFALSCFLTVKLSQNAGVIYKSIDHAIWLLIALMIVVAYLAADFVSGMVHFICDNYGSEKTPLIGEHFIKEFRLHHIDPEDITRYGFIETNGNNCIVAAIALLLTVLLIDMGDIWGYSIGIFMLMFTLFIFATNQFHKWAHQVETGKLISQIQKSKLILGKKHHQIHHNAPFDKYYCITSGLLNPLLHKIGFFEKILKITGKK